MKDIKQIRENYNLITEKEESETNRLAQLVRAGLFDAKKLSFLKRALSKDITKMTSADKKVLLELLDVLMNEVINNTGVYSKVKHNVLAKEEFLDESAKDYTSKFDPRFTKWPSDSEIPVVLILKRKSIRIFPDMQKVALYYAQAIDKYVTIPFGAGVMNEATKDDEDDKKKKTYSPYDKFKAPYRDRQRDKDLADVNVSKFDPNQGGPATERKNEKYRKAVRGIALKTAAKSVGSGDFNAAAAALGFVAGAAARAGAKKLFGSKKKSPSPKLSPGPAPTPAPSNSPSPSPAPGPKLRLVSNTPNPVASSTGGTPKPQLKIVKESFRSKLNEKRKLQEASISMAARAYKIADKTGVAKKLYPHIEPYVKSGLAAAAGLGTYIATQTLPKVSQSLDTARKDAEAAVKASTDTAARERQGERESGASFIARRNLNKRIRASERDAAEIARVSSVSAKLPEIPTTGDDIKLQTPPKTDSGKKVETPATTQAGAAPTPVAQPADVVGVAAAAAAGTAAQTRATSGTKTDAATATKASTTPRQSSDKKTKTPRKPRGFNLPDFKSKPEEPVKYSEPGNFSLKANISGPKPDDTTETRKERERQAFFKEQQEVDDETKKRLVQQVLRQQDRSSRSRFTLKAGVSAPKGSSYNPARDEKQRQVMFRQAQQQTNEQTLIDQLQQARNESLNEYIININESKVTINSTIANKILNVYESLNHDNKIKFEKLLNESSESFKKAVTFSLRQ